MAGDAVDDPVRAGVAAFAAGEALGAPFAGRAPRDVARDDVGAVLGEPGTLTAALLAGPGRSLPGGLALGWAHPAARERLARRAEVGIDGWAVAELGAWALGGRPLHHAVRDHAEEWSPPFRGVRGEREVVSALLGLVFRFDEPSDAMVSAVRLGGDTALLAALAGGILACRRPSAVSRIAWLDRITLPPADGPDTR